MSCSRNGLRAAWGATRNGLSRLGSKAAFYGAGATAAAAGAAVWLYRRRRPAAGAKAEQLTTLPTLSGQKKIQPQPAADRGRRKCTRCGAGKTKKGNWYAINGKNYCQDCAQQAAQQAGVELAGTPASGGSLDLASLAAYWPRRATTLEPVTVSSGVVSNLQGFAVLVAGEKSGLSLMPEVTTKNGQVQVDDNRWFVNYDQANKPLAGPFEDQSQAQEAAALLCNFNWNRSVEEFSDQEVISVKRMLVEFRKRTKSKGE